MKMLNLHEFFIFTSEKNYTMPQKGGPS